MAENAPSNITFSKKEYFLDGKPQNPNIIQPAEKLVNINEKTEMYEAAKVEQRTSCSDLKDQIAESAQKCKANY